MAPEDTITVCPFCYSIEIKSANYTGTAAGKDRNRLCSYCNSSFTAGEFLRLPLGAIVQMRTRWESENRGFVKMKTSMKLER